MIKILKSDNIFDIISKIKKTNLQNKKIILNFPFWHTTLYNKIALKSLKNSFPDKKIIITTNDILAKKIWKQIWIKYSIIKDSSFIEKKDILKYNYSFIEYLNYEIKKIFNKISKKILKKQNNLDPRKKFLKYYKQKTNLPFFIIVLLISILIFSYVFLFSLNKTYVTITPDIQVKNKVQNFIFKENLKDNNLKKNFIKLKKIEKEINLKETIFTTWVKQKEKYRSSWKVIFINKYQTEIKLKNNTRLLSQNWIIYETKKWIKIPAAIKNKAWTIIPWTIETEIIASLRDNYWKITWSRWNIDWNNIIFTLPWLNTEDKKNIYAKNEWKINWWKDIFEKVLWKNDLENAKQIFTQNLKKEAIKQIQKEVENINEINNSKYKILPIDNIYNFSNIKINIPKIDKNIKTDSFEISWKITIKTYIFDINSVISKLKKSIEEKILKDKEKLWSIDNNINIYAEKWILYRKENPLEVKATVEVEYNIEYNFLNTTNNYTKKLKQMISWLEKEKAENILINENKISNAKIEIRPFFINKVSKYLNNIEFKIEK